MRRWQKRFLFLLGYLSVLLLALSTLTAPQRKAAGLTAAAATPVSLGEIVVEAERVEENTAAVSREEILWLARCIYSETKRPEEQELVAWTVRNRVETGYRGKQDYRSVVLDPWQFSAFNRNSSKRRYFMGLQEHSEAAGWKTALEIAERVAAADSAERPFAITTRHFYSARSMPGGRAPRWAWRHRPVSLDRPIDPHRFRFYANVL